MTGNRTSEGAAGVGPSDGRKGNDPNRDLGGDRRRHSARATDRRRAAEDLLLDALLLPNAAYAERPQKNFGAEGQTLLMRALRRLARQEDVDSAVAWSLDRTGNPTVIAAYPAEAGSRIPASTQAFRTLSDLDHVQRLTDSGLSPALVDLAEHGISAAAPVAGMGTRPAAVLLLFPKRSGRALRPRTIAVLAEVAEKLTDTLTTSLAIERMSELGSQVQQLDRLAALGGLVTEIVHEIRNPLVSVKTFLQLLPERLDDPEFHTEFRGVVGDEVQRLERMLDDLLRHARPSQPEPLDAFAHVDEAIETSLQLMTYRCRERGIALETNIRPDLPALGLSQDALKQMLLNLLLNATEVTPQGGQIHVLADWCETSANHVEIRVEDEGPGLDPELIERIFEPFWTTRSDSTGGLGLAICKGIVEAAEGRIEVDRSRKRGAAFRIEIPIAR